MTDLELYRENSHFFNQRKPNTHEALSNNMVWEPNVSELKKKSMCYLAIMNYNIEWLSHIFFFIGNVCT